MLGQLVAVMFAADGPLPLAERNESQAQLILHCRKPRLTHAVHCQTTVGIVYAVIETEPSARAAADFAPDSPGGADRIYRLPLR